MERLISKSLIRLRKSKKLTQTQFGELLGMSRSKVSSWEVGRRDLSVIDAVIISDYFQISLDVLLNSKNISSDKVIGHFENYIRNIEISDEEKCDTFRRMEEILEDNTLCLTEK